MRASIIAARCVSATLLGVLAFGATGVGTAAAANRDSDHASVKIAVTPADSSMIGSGKTFTDTVVVSTEGHATSRDVVLNVQFDPAVVQLQGVQFNRASAWVTKTMPNGFEASLGKLGSDGDSITLTASFVALQAFSPNNPLQAQLNTSWRDSSGSHSSTLTTVLDEASGQTAIPLAATSDGAVNLTSAAFNPGEAVTFWYNKPDGTAATLYLHDGKLVTSAQHKEHLGTSTRSTNVDNASSLLAGAQGQIAIPFSTSGLTPGSYSIVARGARSSITVVTPFIIQ